MSCGFNTYDLLFPHVCNIFGQGGKYFSNVSVRSFEQCSKFDEYLALQLCKPKFRFPSLCLLTACIIDSGTKAHRGLFHTLEHTSEYAASNSTGGVISTPVPAVEAESGMILCSLSFPMSFSLEISVNCRRKRMEGYGGERGRAKS